jgi:hypothetical protein
MQGEAYLVAGGIGLALGLGIAAGWLSAMRSARAARAREAAAADARAREVVEERMVRNARTRSGGDLLVDAMQLEEKAQEQG